ncbi:unnamed protein product [Brachionus calyciflorus]|uniref:PUB domain-containing protein n=1 Tax=Brachionus calyciflorus TaxID=104777 RepID=A0A814R4K5_9BILA|nr:unnamed protein product [Brachionus calyciflorus]
MSESLSLKRLKENSPKDLNQLCETLIDLIQDLIDNPNNSKYKKLEIDSDLIASKLMPFSGGLELLFEIGYEEGDDYFYLPDNFPKQKLNFFLVNLKSILNPKPICSLNSDSICTSTIVSTRSNFGLKNSKNSIFANRLNSSYQHVLIYEDVDLKQKCLSKIPIERLRDQAEQKYQIYSQNNQDKQPFKTRDFLILELLSWFKNEFFKWINQPDCIRCNSNEKMSFIKNDRPNHNEATWQAGNVEVYR